MYPPGHRRPQRSVRRRNTHPTRWDVTLVGLWEADAVKWLLPVLAVVLLGCTRPADDEGATSNSRPAATVSPTANPGPAGSSMPTVSRSTSPATRAVPVTTTSSSTEPVPTTEVSAAAGPTVVYAGSGGYAMMPIGWWDGEWHAVGFVGADAVVPDARPAAVSIVSSDPSVVLTDVPAPADLYYCVDEPGLASIAPAFDLQLDEQFGHSAIAVGATWDVQPRPLRAVGLDSPDYQLAGEALVPTDTGADPTGGDVIQVIRADLDGDGIEEVLFVFERQSEP